ncbi:sulfatase [Roseiconus nitratireducens]|uniref:Sulfatase n=1 Tax=Roseiconus nitratireducens TaxID=2605748 RepID=A0A5M6DDW9_9BACT|nr:sulfatase [Roseiconus nitratireducens]KAA5544636.1 sulfatase [Roseiconus nitratireducens]
MKPSLLCLVASLWFASLADAARPINVILIFADDLGYGDVACFHPEGPFKTPRLDRMAAEGAKLTSFYVPTPYCAPSRGTILTGRYPFRHSVVRNPSPDSGASNFGLPQEEVTLAELLRPNGYATAAYGKWHLGHRPKWLPRTQGFDEYYGILYSNDMYPVQLVENESVVEYPVVQASLTDRYTDRALDFIQRNRDRPFFLYLPHAMPHKPLAVSDNYYTPQTRDDLYADVISELDASIGRILDKLQQLSLDEQTLVIFTSDNGPWYGGSTGGLRGMKGRTWEGGIRVPMIARLPGVIPAGIESDQIAGTIDLLPTICKLVGVEPPQDRVIDGRDITNLLCQKNSPSPHEAIFSMQGKQLATIRSGKWKLHVRNPGPPRFHQLTDAQLASWIDPRAPDGVTILAPYEQAQPTQHPGLISGADPKAMMLFDLEHDPGEQRDVADENPDVVKRLRQQFEKVASEVPDYPDPESDYLFAPPAPGQGRQLMRLIGGELRYDRVPASQQHLLKKP